MLHFALVVAGGLAFAGPAEADTRRFTIGPWSGDAFVIDKRFSHCGALALYNSGVAMMFIVTRRYQWAVGFASDKFSFEEGKTYKLALSLDGDEPTIVTGRAIGNDTIRIDLAPTAELFNKFRRGGSLRLSEQRASYTFDLTDTSKVLPALVQCVNASLNPTPMQTAQLAPHARPTERRRAPGITEQRQPPSSQTCFPGPGCAGFRSLLPDRMRLAGKRMWLGPRKKSQGRSSFSRILSSEPRATRRQC